METSILTSTKKILGIAEEYTVFDLDIITHLNAAFVILWQCGLGPSGGFMIEDETTDWDDYVPNQGSLNLIKTFVFLKVKILFDPPTTSFLLAALEKQADEYIWRISMLREDSIPR